MFVPGNNPEQSLANSHGLPCSSKIKSSDDTFFIPGVYHHMTGEVDYFLKILGNITETWIVLHDTTINIAMFDIHCKRYDTNSYTILS